MPDHSGLRSGLALGGLGVLLFSVSLPATRAAVSGGIDPFLVGFGRAVVAAPLATGTSARPTRPLTYAVGREKIREYARAVGETNPLHLDVEAARAAGYARRRRAADVRRRLQRAGDRPGAVRPRGRHRTSRMMVHGGQEFAWGPLVVAGDEITTTVDGQGHLRARRHRLLRVRVASRPTRTASTVCIGTWTNIVRGGEHAGRRRRSPS